MNKRGLLLAAAVASMAYGCVPPMETNWTTVLQSQHQLKELVRKTTQIDVPDNTFVLEAHSQGVRDSTFCCLLSAPETSLELLLQSASRRLGPPSKPASNTLNDFDLMTTGACAQAIETALIENADIYAYSKGLISKDHAGQTFVLVVRARAWIIIFRPAY